MKTATKIIGIVCALALVLSTAFVLPLTASATSPAVAYDTLAGQTVGTAYGDWGSIAEDNGNKSLKLNNTNGSYKDIWYKVYGIEAGKSYNLQFDATFAAKIPTFRVVINGGVDSGAMSGFFTANTSGQYSYDFTVPAGCTKNYIEVGFNCQGAAVNGKVDNFVLTEKIDGATTGNVLVIDGDTATLTSDVISFDTGAVANGKISQYFTDSVLATAFNGTVEAGKTVVLYSSSREVVQVDNFASATVGTAYSDWGSVAEENGNKYLKLDNTNGSYKDIWYKIYGVLPGKSYNLQFDASFGAKIPTFRVVINGGVDSGAMNFFTANANAHYSYDFTVPAGCTKDFIEVGFNCQGAAVNGSIDNFVLTEVVAGAEAGTVLVFNGDAFTKTCDVTEYDTGSIANGLVSEYYTDKAFANVFDGTVAAGETVVLFPSSRNLISYDTLATQTVGTALKPWATIVENNGNKSLEFNVPAETYADLWYKLYGFLPGKTYNLQFDASFGAKVPKFRVVINGGLDTGTMNFFTANTNGHYSYNFTVPAGCTKDFIEIGFNMSGAVVTGAVDNFVVTEVVAGATAGNAVVISGDSVTAYYDVTSFGNGAALVDGQVTNYYTDSGCTTAFGGTVAAGETVVLYPDSHDAVQYETFDDASAIYTTSQPDVSVDTTEGALKLAYHGDNTCPARFENLILKPNTTYAYSFQYKTIGTASFNNSHNNGTFKFIAARNCTGWHFVYKSAWDNLAELNLMGDDADRNERGRTGKLELPVSNTGGEWNLATGVFFTGNVVQSDCYNLGVNGQGNGTFDLYIDDIVLTEVVESAEAGIILVNQNNTITQINEVTEYMPEYRHVAGKAGSWSVDKSGMVPFEGYVNPTETVMLYPVYRDILQMEAFDSADSVFYGSYAASITDGALKLHYEKQYDMAPVLLKNIRLRPNTTYAYSFQYKTSGALGWNGDKGLTIAAGRLRSDWMFWFENAMSNTYETNLIAGNPDANGYNHGYIALANKTDWTTATGTFNTGSVVNANCNYMVFNAQVSCAFDLFIDDVVLVEIDPSAEYGGTVIINDGTSAPTVLYDQTSYEVPAVTPVDGKIVNWGLDKSGTAEPTGVVGNNEIVTLYQGARDKFAYYDFEDKLDGSQVTVWTFDKVDNVPTVTIDEADAGNKAVHVAFNGTANQSGNFRTNILLKPDTKYVLTYKVMATGKGLNHFTFNACRNDYTGWEYWFKDYGAGDLFNQCNIARDSEGEKAEFWSEDAGVWYDRVAYLDTTGIVSGTRNALGVYTQYGSAEGSPIDFYFDDFILTEVEEDCETATVITVVNGETAVHYNVATDEITDLTTLTETSTVYGSDNFAALYTTAGCVSPQAKALTAKANATYIVYAKSVEPITHICELVKFNNNKSIDVDFDGTLGNSDVDVLINYLLNN